MRSKNWLCLFVALSVAAFANSLHAEGVKVVYAAAAEVMAMFIQHPTPIYPYSARLSRSEGRGIYRIYLNEKGIATKVGVMRSTGHKDLDIAAAAGLMHWRTKPGRRREVDMPVTFRLTRGSFWRTG